MLPIPDAPSTCRRRLEAEAGHAARRGAGDRAEEQRQQAGQVDRSCPRVGGGADQARLHQQASPARPSPSHHPGHTGAEWGFNMCSALLHACAGQVCLFCGWLSVRAHMLDLALYKLPPLHQAICSGAALQEPAYSLIIAEYAALSDGLPPLCHSGLQAQGLCHANQPEPGQLLGHCARAG